MTSTRPISLFNRIFVPLLLIGAGAAFWRDAPQVGIAVLLAVAFVGVTIWRAQRGMGSAYERVNALQPYDERDRELTMTGFGYLGMALFIVQTLLFLYAAVTHGDITGEAVRLLAVCLISIVATTVAVRRG
ncbi:MAG: hypothetical protein LWW86_07210 [Micrococcales bacterium]|nr:hypothetical protein [Micrococcales bacterium]